MWFKQLIIVFFPPLQIQNLIMPHLTTTPVFDSGLYQIECYLNFRSLFCVLSFKFTIMPLMMSCLPLVPRRNVVPWGKAEKNPLYPDGNKSNNIVYNATAVDTVSKIIWKGKGWHKIIIEDASMKLKFMARFEFSQLDIYRLKILCYLNE